MSRGWSWALGHVQNEWIWRLIHNRYTRVIPTWCQREFIELRDIPETLTSRTHTSINPFMRTLLECLVARVFASPARETKIFCLFCTNVGTYQFFLKILLLKYILFMPLNLTLVSSASVQTLICESRSDVLPLHVFQRESDIRVQKQAKDSSPRVTLQFLPTFSFPPSTFVFSFLLSFKIAIYRSTLHLSPFRDSSRTRAFCLNLEPQE